MATIADAEDVLRFWFPTPVAADRDAVARRIEWWFRGRRRSRDRRTIRAAPRARVRGRPGPVGRDAARAARAHRRPRPVPTVDPPGHGAGVRLGPKAVALALEGIACGHYDALSTPWEKTFFFLPLGHSEDLAMVERAVALAEALVAEAPADVRWWLEFSRTRRAAPAT
jgi:uncharacterized protein (DUF924 family)